MPITKREFLLYSTASVLSASAGAGHILSAGSAFAMEKKMPLNIIPVLRKADTLSDEQVFTWMKQLRGHPFVTQSGFDVTSVFKVKADEGMFYVAGVNVENSDLTTGTCGEEGAIATAICAFGQKIDILEGWVMGAPKGAKTSDIACYPCGECRQRIAQYTGPDAPIHVMALNGKKLDTKTRSQLLPHAFSFRDLEHNGAAATVSPPAAMENVASRLYRKHEKPLTEKEIFEWLQGLRGDVRVSDYNEMAIWRLDDGSYVAGVKVENAAYPSSTNVMSATAALMNAHYGNKKVEEVWAHGFYNATDKQAKLADKHHVSTGAGLQVLKQFAANDGIKVHQFNSLGMIKTESLSSLLSNASVFKV
ncbi:MAG: hypothetical protein MK052_00655 [Alphaproteobacteria bacterium]|nr:hypothetical protein [Alphaproteobacteria bacterium]